MRLANRLFLCLWWSAQGIVWFDIRFITTSLCLITGVILILCGISSFSSNKDISVISLLLLMLYSVCFICFIFMVIAVGSPQIWFAVFLAIVALSNVAFCIIKGFKLIKG